MREAVKGRLTLAETTPTRDNGGLTRVKVKSNAYKKILTRVKKRLTRCKLTPNAVRRGSNAYNGPWSRLRHPTPKVGRDRMGGGRASPSTAGQRIVGSWACRGRAGDELRGAAI